MWEAWNEDRLDGVVAVMQPDVTWRPITRPGVDAGHDGIHSLHAEVSNLLGRPRVRLDDVTFLADGTVWCVGESVFEGGTREPFGARFTFRDGLIARIGSSAAAPPSIEAKPPVSISIGQPAMAVAPTAEIDASSVS
jgi:hypothetical protein